MAFESAIPERIMWVSADGDDANSGARDAPLASIQLAIDRATPGTAILIKSGDYSGNLTFEKIQGTPDKPIWLAAADGPGTVTITATSETESVITIRGEDNLIIRDLVLSGGYDGIEIGQSGTDFTNLVENIVLRGNTVLNAAHDGIKVGQATNVAVVGNHVDGAGDQGIDLLGVTSALIDGNEIENVTGSSGMFAKGGSSDLTITNNYIHDVSGDGLLVGGWTDADNFLPGTGYEARNVVVTGNVVEAAAKRPLTVRGAEDVDIHDNFFGSLPGNAAVILVGSGSPDLSPPPPSMRVSIHDNVFDRAEHFADIQAGSTDISIVDNVKNGVIEGDIRPFPPLPDGAFAAELPEALLDAPEWPTSARSYHSFTAGDGNQTLTGTDGHDFLSGGSGGDTTIGGAGDDIHSIGSSHDIAVENPGEGVDTAIVYIDAYTLPENIENLTVAYGAGGVYSGNALNNILKGGPGGDLLAGGAGADLLLGGAGTDTASYAASEAGVTVSLATGIGAGGDAEGDRLSGIENLSGSSAGDVLEGDAGDNLLDGGEGSDTASYAHAAASVAVSLATTAGQDTGGAGTDTLAGFENLEGSDFADQLTGNGGDNQLRGRAGDDEIRGGGGSDTLAGGAGRDWLSGGKGADTFLFSLATDGRDSIAGFDSGVDRFFISAEGFGGGLSPGDGPTLVKTGHAANADGPDGHGYFIFDRAGGNAGTLYFDPTGGDASDAIAIARLLGDASLKASDLLIV